MERQGANAMRRTPAAVGDLATLWTRCNGRASPALPTGSWTRATRLLASRIDDAQLTTFPGLGHLFFWEDPGAFAAAVTSFLRDEDGGR
jgi:pimeloyl-ACP methyl ester carboxylesterase